MANEEQLDILKQGIKVWNLWRQEHGDIRPDLSGAYLCFATLREANLYKANLESANLRGANLSGANLSGANLSSVFLCGGGVNLSGANLSKAYLSNVDLSGAETDLHEAYLRKAYLRNVDLTRADLNGADLSEATLEGADLSETHLSEATLKGADLNGANLSKAYLDGADLSGAILSEANLRETHLNGADLNGADLNGADLNGANLNGANLTNANIGWTTFGGIDLQNVKGLETLKHAGPSTIGIDTIIVSQGNIPETFLRQAGVPSSIIEAIPSLIGSLEPIQYYTCFISYSSKDQDFAEQLYNDLQGKGVRCWFAPEDLDIGDKIRPRIEESIRLYNKLLLVLSEHSIASKWVAYEVERALNKEPEGVPNVLYPVRLDEAVMKSKAGWADDIRRTRHIGDFTHWKNHNAYQKAFTRLLRALKPKVQKAEEP